MVALIPDFRVPANAQLLYQEVKESGDQTVCHILCKPSTVVTLGVSTYLHPADHKPRSTSTKSSPPSDMACTAADLPALPEIDLQPPPSILASKAFTYATQHCTEAVYNHVIRSAYWGMIIAKKIPEFRNNPSLNLEAVFVSCILHDMGWAKTPELLSADKRFEVDGANIARDFIEAEQSHLSTEPWSHATIQRIWDSIALHTTPSIAEHAAPEVALTNLGITADFAGPALTGPDGKPLILIEEYRAVMKAFPRAGFNSEGFKSIMCWLCRTKPETTYDNFVGEYGCQFGPDGNGEGIEEFREAWTARQSSHILPPGLDMLETLDPK